MKPIKKLFAFFIMALLLGCSKTSPEAYFDQAVLSSNLITAYYTPKFFGKIIELKTQNRITVFRQKTPEPASVTQYLKNYLPDLSKNISGIKSLKKTAETKEMLEASVSYFEHANKIFKNDYFEIAGMMDENRPQAEIDAAIKKIFETNDRQMSEKHHCLWKAAEIFAKENDIPMPGK